MLGNPITQENPTVTLLIGYDEKSEKAQNNTITRIKLKPTKQSKPKHSPVL
jgi:hypothetical protein